METVNEESHSTAHLLGDRRLKRMGRTESQGWWDRRQKGVAQAEAPEGTHWEGRRPRGALGTHKLTHQNHPARTHLPKLRKPETAL